MIAFLFHVLILSILFTVEPTNSKNSYSQITEKHDQTSVTLANVFDFICHKATMYVSELILTPFNHLILLLSAKLNLKWKTSESVFLGHIGDWVCVCVCVCIILLILLFLLLYYCWFAGWTWHPKISDNKLLPVAARNVLSYGLEKFVGLHVFTLVHQT